MAQSVSTPTHSERLEAAEAVEEDQDLLPMEKEFSVSFAKDENKARVDAEIGSITKRLIRHPHFEILDVRVSDADRFGARLSFEQWQTDGAPITGVRGYIPIGCLKVLSRPRADNYPSQVVSAHDPAGADGSDGGSP